VGYAAVIFDLDGTLIDSEPLFKAVAKRAASEMNQHFSDELYLDLVGLPNSDVESGICAAFGPDFAINEFRHRFEALWVETVAERGIDLKPGALVLLDRLAALGIRYAVATSTSYERARLALNIAGIGTRIDHMIGGDQVDNGKPAPDIYLAAAKSIAVSPLRCIAIEDSSVGIQSAAAANMYTIMVPDLKPPDAHARNLVAEMLPSLDEAMVSVLHLIDH